MAATRIDGKALAAKLKENVRGEAASLPRKPGLAVILVGEDPASRVYVTSKRKDCEECGFYSEEYALPAQTTQKQLLELVAELNGRADIDGILVQLPLPKGLDEREVLLAIDPGKDVDCFHPYNVGQLTIGAPVFQPCTPGGKALCRAGPSQHCGQAHGAAAAPRPWHGGDVPLQNAGSEGAGCLRRYSGISRG